MEDCDPASAPVRKISPADSDCSNIPIFSKVEQIVINRLVGVDSESRKVVVEKLGEWLNALEERFPDYTAQYDPDSRLVAEMKQHFGRIWKMMFCSVLIVQDEAIATKLSESMAEYLNILGRKSHLALLFTERFFLLLIEEWGWIRPLFKSNPSKTSVLQLFIKQVFQMLAVHEWKEDYVDPFLNIIDIHVLNHHPPPPRTTRAGSKTPVPLQAPVELQIQLARIILEQLPISHPKIVRFLLIFVKELFVETKSDILAEEIIRCMSNYITKASDVAASDNIETIGMTLQEIELNDNLKHVKPVLVNTSAECDSTRIDTPKTDSPRLYIDYGSIVLQLRQSIGTKGSQTEGLLQDLLQKFDDLHTRTNANTSDASRPILAPLVSERNYSLPVKDTTAVVSTINKRKRKFKVPQKLLLSATVVESEDATITKWSSIYLNDPELLDHICDNYMSYLVEFVRPIPSPSSSEDPSTEGNTEEVEKEPRINNQMFKRRKLAFDLDAAETGKNNCVNGGLAIVLDDNIAVIANNGNTENLNVETINGGWSEITTEGARSDSALPNEVYAEYTPLKRKLPNPSRHETNVNGNETSDLAPNVSNLIASVTPTPFPKCVRFVLANNLEHDYEDYEISVEENLVPYNESRSPMRSLLKSKSPGVTPAIHWKKKAAASAVYSSASKNETTSETAPKNGTTSETTSKNGTTSETAVLS